MKQIRIDFVDLCSTLRRDNNIILDALKKHYDVVIDVDNPDYIFYGDNGATHWRYKKPIKIYVAQENRMPNFRYCHYAMSFLDLRDPRNIRLPFYVHVDYHTGPEALVKREDEALKEKTKFCAFIVSNQNIRRTSKRVTFFEKLSRYKQVDSGGRVMNNIGSLVGNKREFLRDYKFTMAFENRSYNGYTTEKLVDAMHARSLPIHWGNPDVARDFNTESFINVHDFGSDDEVIEYIEALDKDDALYNKVASQPYFHGNQVPEIYRPEYFEDFLKEIFDKPLSEHRRDLIYTRHILFNIKKNLEPVFGLS